MRHPIAPLLGALIAGILLGDGIPLPPAPLWIGIALSGLALVLALRLRRRGWVWVAALPGVLLSGALAIQPYAWTPPGPFHVSRFANQPSLVLDGIVRETPLWSEGRATLLVEARQAGVGGEAPAPATGLVHLSLEAPAPVRYGDAIRCRTTLRRPRNFGNPGGFDYERHLRRQGVLVRGAVKPTGIVVLRERQGNPLRQRIEDARTALKECIRRHARSPEREIVQALILGNQREIPREVQDKFNRTGTSHIIAISGFNVGIIAAVAVFAARFVLKRFPGALLRLNLSVAATLFAAVPVAVFTLIAGMGISVLRAAIMALCFLAALIGGRERNLYNTLAWAALLILAVSPSSLFDVSFQLSFAAVGGILFLSPRLARVWPPRAPGEATRAAQALRGAFLFVVATISASLATLPLIVCYFNRASVILLLSNMAVVPILGILAVPVSMAIILAAPLSEALAALLVGMSAELVRISLALVEFFDGLPGAALSLATPTLPETAAYYLSLIALAKATDGASAGEKRRPLAWVRRNPFWTASLAGLALFFAADGLYRWNALRPDGRLEITALDVGHGASVFVRFPDGRRMLVDGGGTPQGRFDTGRHLVGPYLWRRGFRRLDLVVLTHPHPDHLEGLPFVLERFDVREFWSNGQAVSSEAYQDLVRILCRKDIPHLVAPRERRQSDFGGAILEVLHPTRPLAPVLGRKDKFEVANDNSLVLRIAYKDVQVLLPADIGAPVEESLLRATQSLASQVLLAPHHGGRGSSSPAFLAAVKPAWAVVSCGRGRPGNPHPEVLDRYRAAGTTLLRTDRNGAVRCVTDGVRWDVTPFREAGAP